MKIRIDRVSMTPFNISLYFFFSLLPVYLLIANGIESIYPWILIFLFNISLLTLVVFRTDDYLYASMLAFFYCFLIVAAILQTAGNSFPWHGYYSKDAIANGWMISILALFSFELGYFFTKKKPGKKLISLLLMREIDIAKLITFGSLYTLILLYFIGLDSIFLTRGEFSKAVNIITGGNSSISPIMVGMLRVPGVIFLLIIFNDFFFKLERKIKIQTKTKLLIIFYSLFIMIVNNPISTPRFWIGAIFLSISLLYLKHCTRKRAFFWFSLNIFIITSIFPVMDLYRRTIEADIFVAFSNTSPADELLSSPDFDAFQQQMNTVILTEKQGYMQGKSTLSSLLFFVPRKIWPGKSEPSGVIIGRGIGYNFVNLSEPIFAEFYLDGWFFGVIFGGLALGFIYKSLYFSSIRTSSMSIFYVFFCSYQFYFLRGSLMAVLGFLSIAILTFLLLNLTKRIQLIF